ncbi:hypothetical protein BST61_g3449 [Cercospora zeina]
MAYNRGYNPDALPAHAEPEQAAQMLNNGAPPRRDPPGSNTNYNNKPVPPAPTPAQNLRPQQDDRYGRQSPAAGGYRDPQPPGAYGSSNPPPPQNQGYSDYGRGNSPRYDQYNQQPRYGGQGQQGGHGGPPPQQGYGQAPPPRSSSTTYGGVTSPPPASYGQGPPPQGYHNRPAIPEHQRPPTVAPPRDGNDKEALWPLFLQVDRNRTGQLSEAELSSALVNGDYTAFDHHTIKMMIRMFDTDRSGTINFDEFCGLWGFLSAWRGLFDRFDTFAAACISLKRMTDVFKKYDSDRDGYITLSFEEFLTEILKQR